MTREDFREQAKRVGEKIMDFGGADNFVVAASIIEEALIDAHNAGVDAAAGLLRERSKTSHFRNQLEAAAEVVEQTRVEA